MTFVINLFFLATFIPIGIIFFNLKLRYAKNITVILFILGGLLCTIVETSVTHSSPLLFPFSFLCIAIILLVLFNATLKIVLLLELSSYFVISLLYLIIGATRSQLSIISSINNSLFSLTQSIIIFLLVLAFSIYIYAIHNNKNHLTISYLTFFTVVIVIDGTILIAIGIFLFVKMKISNAPLGLFIYLLLITGILIQIILLIYMIKSRDLHKENEHLAKQYLENQIRYYEYLVQREEDTKKFRHDIRSHISMLNILFQENKVDECKDYLQDLTTHYENIHNAVSVNSCIADAILNKYYYEVQNHNIKLNVTGHFPSDCKLAAYDICTIFSNLLENALKAVLECNGNEINVSCRYTETEIFILIENDSNYIKLDEGEIPYTSKNDKTKHGFGLKNVQQCVSQNNGHISIQSDDKHFRVLLSLSRGN